MFATAHQLRKLGSFIDGEFYEIANIHPVSPLEVWTHRGSDFQRMSMPNFTPKQGQYLAYIYAYSVVLGRPPAERDIQRHFRVSPPTVHQMILTLERERLIQRTPGAARSIQLLLGPELLPILRQ